MIKSNPGVWFWSIVLFPMIIVDSIIDRKPVREVRDQYMYWIFG